MSADAQGVLERQLAEFIVPQTNRPLGSHGTSFSVQSDGSEVKITLNCGFPASSVAESLRQSLAEFVESRQPGCRAVVDIEWAVRAHAVQPGVSALPGIRNIVAIASGKGGVGKSTVTVNLAVALAQEGARVGILDADIYGPSQPRMLDLLGERPETRDGKMLDPLEAHGVAVMSIGFLVDEGQAVAWRGPMVTSALNQMLSQTDWGELDYLFVDMPPGTGDIQLTLAQKVPVSGAVIVTTPQDVALSDARKAVDMFRKLKLPILGVVENMSVFVCGDCGNAVSLFGEGGGDRLAREYELPVLAQLPLVPSIREQTDTGRPTVIAEPDGAPAALWRAAALRVAGELAATGRDYSHHFSNVKVEAKP